MRTIWKGSISFGLVTIPVGVCVATKREDIAFRQLHEECGTPIKQKRWCPVHERDVDDHEIVRGWEFSKGQYVVVEDAELEAIALERSHTVEITKFVEVAQVDPLYFDRTYLLEPAPDPASRRPYALLLRAMENAGMAAVGKFVMWSKENLCLIRASDDALVMETLFYADDVRSRAEITEAVDGAEINDLELELAMQVIERYAGDFEPAEFENEHRRHVREMLEAKLAGAEIRTVEAAAPMTPTVDLMAALKASVEATKKKRPARKREREKQPA